MSLSRYVLFFISVIFSQSLSALTLIPSKKSRVKFEAEITMSSFDAVSKKVYGEVLLDEKKKEINSATLFIPIASLKTGLSLRDKHMRKKYLDKNNHPNISFVVHKKQKYKIDGPFVIKGYWKIKGKKVEKEITVIPSALVMEKGIMQSISLKSNFSLNITDFSIKQPKYLMVEMSPIIRVKLELYFQNKKSKE